MLLPKRSTRARFSTGGGGSSPPAPTPPNPALSTTNPMLACERTRPARGSPTWRPGLRRCRRRRGIPLRARTTLLPPPPDKGSQARERRPARRYPRTALVAELASACVANHAPARAPASCRIRSHEPANRKPAYAEPGLRGRPRYSASAYATRLVNRRRGGRLAARRRSASAGDGRSAPNPAAGRECRSGDKAAVRYQRSAAYGGGSWTDSDMQGGRVDEP